MCGLNTKFKNYVLVKHWYMNYVKDRKKRGIILLDITVFLFFHMNFISILGGLC